MALSRCHGDRAATLTAHIVHDEKPPRITKWVIDLINIMKKAALFFGRKMVDCNRSDTLNDEGRS